jgi:EAL domain-containing protein (putative c-di-GMP-specific phosphodiesterase class I)
MLFLAVHSAMGALFSHLKQSLQDSEEINWLLGQEKEALARTNSDLEQVAFKDTVTGLPNNKKLIKDIGKIIADNEGRSYFIHQVLVDIQGFEELNIKYGLDMGNEILRSLGFALAGLPDCEVYRMTGAKFLIHCFSHTEKSRDFLDRREEQINELMKTPISLGKDALEVHYRGVSIQYPEDIGNPTLLVSNLMMSLNDDQYGEIDTIMRYSGKKAGKIIRKNTIQELMNRAIEKGELSVYIQPRMSLSDGSIVGGELLTRWDSRYYGAISPTEFIPIAELSHHIIDLTHFVFRSAADYCRFFTEQPSPPAQPYTLSVNISPVIIKANRMEEFIQYTRPLRDCGHFEFELTEGFFLNLTDTVQNQMVELHANQIKVAVDDFGTGYSNLEYLQELNVDVLKIDRKFIRGIPHDKKMTHLVLAIVNMAKALELRTVAEGVEYREQLRWLQAQGVDEIQGFLLAKPMDLSYFRAFFVNHDPLRWI